MSHFSPSTAPAAPTLPLPLPSVTRSPDLVVLTAGAASALNGFLMMVAAFAMGGWLGRHMDGTVYPLADGVWFWSVWIALVAWTLVQKYGAARAD